MPQKAQPGAFPPRWRERVWTLAQLAHIVEVPFDTVYTWFQLARALDCQIGQKSGVRWMFDAHELYFFRMLSSIYRMGLPVGFAQIKAVYHHAYGDSHTMRAPGEDGYFQQYSEDKTAAVSIDAPKVFEAIRRATA